MEMMGHFIAFDKASYDEITHQQCRGALDTVAVAPELFDMIKRETLESCDGDGDGDGDCGTTPASSTHPESSAQNAKL